MSSSPASSSAAKHRQTNPEDRLSLREKAGYSAGGMSYTLLGNSIGNMANVVLNIGLGMNPFLVGLLLVPPCVVRAAEESGGKGWHPISTEELQALQQVQQPEQRRVRLYS